MSDTDPAPSSNTSSQDTGQNAANEALAKINALLEQIQSKKDEFDSVVAASQEVVQKGVEDAKSVASQANDLKTELTKAQSEIAASKDSITDLITVAKKSSGDVDTLKTDIATIKGAMETEQQTAIAALGVVTQSKADIEALKAAATSLSDSVSAENSNVTANLSRLKDQSTALQELVTQLTEVKSAAETDGETIKVFLGEVDKAKAQFAKLETDTTEKHEELTEQQEALQSKITEIEESHTQISELHKRLLEGTGDAESIQDEIDGLHKQISDTLKEVSDGRDAAVTALTNLKTKFEGDGKNTISEFTGKFEALHAALEMRILALLPSAGAAGLASTYYDAKSRYAPTSYKGKLGAPELTGWKAWFRAMVGNNPASVVAIIFFYAMFLLPLGGIIYWTYDLAQAVEHTPNIQFEIFVLRFLIVVPLATISGFGFASLHLYRRLYEEYNHKQRVMELYRSFKEEIDSSGDKEQIKALRQIMLDSVAAKAWASTRSDSEGKKLEDSVSAMDRLADVVAKIVSLPKDT